MVASDLLVVDFAQKDDVLKLYPEAPLLSSDRVGWDGVQLAFLIKAISAAISND